MIGGRIRVQSVLIRRKAILRRRVLVAMEVNKPSANWERKPRAFAAVNAFGEEHITSEYRNSPFPLTVYGLFVRIAHITPVPSQIDCSTIPAGLGSLPVARERWRPRPRLICTTPPVQETRMAVFTGQKILVVEDEVMICRVSRT